MLSSILNLVIGCLMKLNIYKRFLKWYPNLSDRLLWLTVLKKSLKILLNDFHNDLGLKNRLKLYRMYIHLYVIGLYEK